jgi:hypothetical protein
MKEFASSVDRLEGVVRQACAGEDEWPARVAAGIRATVDFVVDHPQTARTLTLDLRVEGLERKYIPVIERFSKLLAAETPRSERPKTSTEEALVGGIASVIASHVRSGSLEQLEQQAPDLIYFALLPCLGYDEAKRWV